MTETRDAAHLFRPDLAAIRAVVPRSARSSRSTIGVRVTHRRTCAFVRQAGHVPRVCIVIYNLSYEFAYDPH